MIKPTITEFENLIEKERKEYFSCLHETLCILSGNPTKEDVVKQTNILHNKGVSFFNIFERSIDEYSLPYFKLNIDTKNRKIEDAEAIIDLILNHWETLRSISVKYSLITPVPSVNAYSSIQRFLKCFQPKKVEELKDKFMAANLPTNGFENKTQFSGWQIGSRNLTITQIIIGLLFILAAGLIIFNKEDLTGMQYFFSRAVLSLGLTIIGSALLEGTVKLDWTIQKSITIKAVGWVALFIMLYYINPPSIPIP